MDKYSKRWLRADASEKTGFDDVRDVERRTAVAHRTPAPPVIDLDAELEMDTITMPVVGDHVHYSRGSGYLVGLEGVVVTEDHEPDLPSGLRYVLFDGEDWPKVVGVGNLERA